MHEHLARAAAWGRKALVLGALALAPVLAAPLAAQAMPATPIPLAAEGALVAQPVQYRPYGHHPHFRRPPPPPRHWHHRHHGPRYGYAPPRPYHRPHYAWR